jgi:hypothetical protein
MKRREVPPPLNANRILRTLLAHDVRFVVIGGIAANLHGAALLTKDLDVMYERERGNLRRLAAALAELRARRRDVPAEPRMPVDERTLVNGTNFLLDTAFGWFDLLAETSAYRRTYEQLAPNAEQLEVDRGVKVAVVSLDDLIRMKREAGRPQDLMAVEHLSALRDERELREAGGAYARRATAAPARGARRGRARPARRGPSRTRAR